MPDPDPDIQQSLIDLLESEGIDREQLREVISLIDPVDLAEFFEDLDLDDRVRIFDVLDPDRGAQVLAAMPHERKVELVEKLGEEKLANIVHRMPDSAVADIIDHLPAHKETQILAQLEKDHAADIRELRKYEEHTAGGRMTRNFVTVPDTFTAGQTLKALQGAVDSHTVEFVYVVDERGRLEGICSLPKLIIHAPEIPVAKFMRRDFTFVGANTDQEEVARIAQKYRLRAVPVVDNEMKLVGVVTLQSIIDVVHQEANEDAMKFAGSNLVDSLTTPTWTRLRMRLPWLILTLAGELVIALVISKFFQATLAQAAILAAFMPAIAATGGNVGVQSSILVVRSLGMGTIRAGRMLRVVFTEFRLGILLGAICGVVAGGVAIVLGISSPSVSKLGLTVCLALVSATSATSLVGTVVPLVLHRMKRDPALACGPFVTMFNDLFGTTVYFSIAMALNFSTR